MKKDNVNQERKHVSMINEYDLTYSKEKVQTLAQMQTERDDEAKKMARFKLFSQMASGKVPTADTQEELVAKVIEAVGKDHHVYDCLTPNLRENLDIAKAYLDASFKDAKQIPVTSDNAYYDHHLVEVASISSKFPESLRSSVELYQHLYEKMLRNGPTREDDSKDRRINRDGPDKYEPHDIVIYKAEMAFMAKMRQDNPELARQYDEAERKAFESQVPKMLETAKYSPVSFKTMMDDLEKKFPDLVAQTREAGIEARKDYWRERAQDLVQQLTQTPEGSYGIDKELSLVLVGLGLEETQKHLDVESYCRMRGAFAAEVEMHTREDAHGNLVYDNGEFTSSHYVNAAEDLQTLFSEFEQVDAWIQEGKEEHFRTFEIDGETFVQESLFEMNAEDGLAFRNEESIDEKDIEDRGF